MKAQSKYHPDCTAVHAMCGMEGVCVQCVCVYVCVCVCVCICASFVGFLRLLCCSMSSLVGCITLISVLCQNFVYRCRWDFAFEVFVLYMYKACALQNVNCALLKMAILFHFSTSCVSYTVCMWVVPITWHTRTCTQIDCDCISCTPAIAWMAVTLTSHTYAAYTLTSSSTSGDGSRCGWQQGPRHTVHTLILATSGALFW